MESSENLLFGGFGGISDLGASDAYGGGGVFDFPLLNELRSFALQAEDHTFSETFATATQLMMSADHAVVALCRLADQSLYGLVKRAKKLPIFSHLDITQQMGLLRGSWIDGVLFDYLQRQVTTSA